MSRTLIIDGSEPHQALYRECGKQYPHLIVHSLEEAEIQICSKHDFRAVVVPWHLAHNADGKLLDCLIANARGGRSCILLGSDSEWRDRHTKFAGHATDILGIPLEKKLFENALDRANYQFILRDLQVQMPGSSAAWGNVLRDVAQAAISETNVLITGESGTGKTTLANCIHRFSSRGDKGIMAVPLGEIVSKDHVASALFGHVKGAFTGAIETRSGAFKLGNDSTVFLDEIGDLPLESQVSLLGVLRERTYRALGSDVTQKFAGRVIAATKQPLERFIAEGRFRDDLYFRFEILIELPPMRERMADLEELIAHFLPKKATLDVQFRKFLERFAFPGNVDQLRSIISLAGDHAKLRRNYDGTLLKDDVPAKKFNPPRTLMANAGGISFPDALFEKPYDDAKKALLSEFDPIYYKNIMQRAGYKKKDAAQIAGLSEKTFRRLEDKEEAE